MIDTEKRLINANLADRRLADDNSCGERFPISWFRSWLALQETVNAVEVVHGQWIRKPIGKYTGVDEVCCSICGCFIGVVASDTAFREGIEGMNYCYNCGARMDGK